MTEASCLQSHSFFLEIDFWHVIIMYFDYFYNLYTLEQLCLIKRAEFTKSPIKSAVLQQHISTVLARTLFILLCCVFLILDACDQCWLDKDKAIVKQLGSADTPLRFCVKFYTPDPGLLEDELTR